MDQNDCTALIRYVAPQSRPPTSPTLTFFSLAREIRDEIYRLSLVSSSPIIVWKGKWMVEYLRQPYSWDGPPPRPMARVRWRLLDHDTMAASHRSLNLNLLLCSKRVCQEAATMLYKNNAFSFLGDHNWDPVVTWLHGIGAVNRNLITSIEINGRQPDRAWQMPDGSRIRHPGGFTMEELYPRHPLFQTGVRPLKRGHVDNINPAIEDIFVLLGQRSSREKVRIVMQLDAVYPGSPGGDDEQCPEAGWYSMDLANLIEKFRELHVTGDDLVEVLWKGRNSRLEMPKQREIVEKIGWKMIVLPVEEDDMCFWPGWPKVAGGIAKYVLKREKLQGPLTAQDPCPFS